MVLWIPPGAHSFACRQRWGRSVAYASQFSTRIDRAHQEKRRSMRGCAGSAASIPTNGICRPSRNG
jgi:hypothetical protein